MAAWMTPNVTEGAQVIVRRILLILADFLSVSRDVTDFARLLAVA